MTDSELMAYCETVQCVYEHCMEILSKDAPGKGEEAFFRQLSTYRDKYGISAVRDCMRDKKLIYTVDAGWEKIKDGGNACFDWEYVPEFLNRCMTDSLSLRDDWRERLARRFPEVSESAGAKAVTKHVGTVILEDVNRIRMLCDLCHIDSEASREKYGVEGYDAVIETIDFGNGIEADIKACIPDNGGNWTECVFFKNGSEAAFSDPGEEFFGQAGEFEIDGETYVANVYARINGELLKTQEDVEKKLAELDAMQSRAPFPA